MVDIGRCNTVYRYLKCSVILTCCAIVLSCNSKYDLEYLFDVSKYDDVIALANKIDLNSVNDPSDLIIISSSLVELGKKSDHLRQYDSLKASKKAFIDAYVGLCSGKYEESEKHFIELSEKEDGAVFGFVGLLECYLKCGDINRFEKTLEKLRCSKRQDWPSWVVPTYGSSGDSISN